MIAKGNLHGSGGFLAHYLMTGDENEIAQLVETRGLDFLGRDPVEAFEMLQKVAEANTQSSKPFFHTQTRNPDGDKQLTDEQWLQIADREEKRLGFDGQPRIVSFHIEKDTGEKHMHVAWCRIDLETMRSIDPGLFKNNLKQLCRSLEKEYELKEVSSERKPDDIARIADRKEIEEARRLGMDVREVRNAILDCLTRTDNGKAFRAALDEHGLMLSNGDKRDCFVVIDQAGGHHALNKKLTGLTLGAMRDRLGDLDRAQLPSVEQAKAMQQEKHPTPEQAREAWDLSLDRLHNMAGRYDPLRPETAPQQQRDEKPQAPQPKPAPEPEKAAKEQEQPAAKEQAAQGERWQERPATKMEEKIFRILDGAERGGADVAAGLQAEGITLARVDAAGIAAKDTQYRREFENEKLAGNADARLRRSVVKEGELVAVTKSGDVFRLNPRFLDLAKLERAATGTARANGGTTPSLSAALEHFAHDRQQQRQDRHAAQHARHESHEALQQPRGFAHDVKDAINDLKGAGKDKGFKVVDGKGMVTSLASFVESLFGMGKAAHAPDQQQHAPGRGGDAYEAMQEIYERSQRGEDLSAESIRNLPPACWENLRSHGDSYMQAMIRDFEIEKEQEAARSWEEYDHDRMGRER